MLKIQEKAYIIVFLFGSYNLRLYICINKQGLLIKYKAMKTLELKKQNRVKGQNHIMTGEVDTVNGYFIVNEKGINYSYELRLFQEIGTNNVPVKEKRGNKEKAPKVKKERKERVSTVYQYRFYGAWGMEKECYAAEETSFTEAAKSVDNKDTTFFEHDWNKKYTKHDIKTGKLLYSKKCKTRPWI
jgi:LysM repeat protein